MPNRRAAQTVYQIGDIAVVQCPKGCLATQRRFVSVFYIDFIKEIVLLPYASGKQGHDGTVYALYLV